MDTNKKYRDLDYLAEFEIDPSLTDLVLGGDLRPMEAVPAATNAGFCVNSSCGNGLCGNDLCVGTGGFNTICLHHT